MLSVITACVGDFPMGRDYVWNLHKGLVKSLGEEKFKMYVITDKPWHYNYPIHPVTPFRDVWGWWNKYEIFRTDHACPWTDQAVLWMDLDMVIRGNMGWVTEQMEPTFTKPWGRVYGYETPFNDTIGTTMIYLPAWDKMEWVWKSYVEFVSAGETWERKRDMNDQFWLGDCIQHSCISEPAYWQDEFPDYMCSYKRGCVPGVEPASSLVVFHGQPRPHEAINESPWIAKYWKP